MTGGKAVRGTLQLASCHESGADGIDAKKSETDVGSTARPEMPIWRASPLPWEAVDGKFRFGIAGKPLILLLEASISSRLARAKCLHQKLYE